MAGNTAEAGRSVASKVACILLAYRQGSEFSLTEIARLTGLPIATTHRLAGELMAAGVLVRRDNARYRIGFQLRGIGGELAPASLHERARRVMEDLSAAWPRGTVRLGVLDGLEVSLIEKPEGTRPVSTVFQTVALPIHATAMGKALLAFTHSHVVERVVSGELTRYTRFTITCREQLLRMLATTRLRRFAVAQQELELGRFDIAVPVFTASKGTVTALEVSVRQPQDLRLVQPAVMMAARALSRELQANHGTDGLMIGAKRQLDMMIHSTVLDDHPG